MSSSLPTMIPNEPPPYVDGENADQNQDLDFSSRLSLDISAEPSPMSSPEKFGVHITGPFRPDDLCTGGTDNNPDEDEFGEFLSCEGLSDAMPASSHLKSLVENETCDTNVGETKFKISKSVEPNHCAGNPENGTNRNDQVQVHEHKLPECCEQPCKLSNFSENPIENSTVYNREQLKEPQPQVKIDTYQTAADDVNNDDFGDFSDYSSSQQPASSLSTSSDTLQSLNNYQSLVKSIFNFVPALSSEEHEINYLTELPIDRLLNDSHCSSWSHIHEFEDSHCLLFKWLNSIAQQRLFKSLSISKSTTMMYSTKWGAIVEVPKFAASLLETPLQPQALNPTGSSNPDFDEFQSHKNNNNSQPEKAESKSLSGQGHHNGTGVTIPKNQDQEILSLFD